MNEKTNILLVEDDSDQAELTKKSLQKYSPHFDVEIALSGGDCLQKLKEGKFDAIILDYKLPELSGLEVLESLNQKYGHVPVIVATGRGDEKVAVEAMKRGACDYIVKESGYLATLPRIVSKAIEKYRLESELQASEERLQQLILESKNRLQAVFDSITDIISVQDLDYKIIMANKRIAELCGTTPQKLIGKRCYATYFHRENPCDNCPVTRTMYSKKPDFSEITSGDEIYHSWSYPMFNLNGELEYVIEYGKNVTEQKLLERKLIQSEKLATVGLLSSGIAHELRNPLNIIETARYYIEESLKGGDPELQKKLEIIKRNISRASNIINNLLEFSRHSEYDKEIIDINKLIDSVLSLIEKELSSQNIHLVRQYGKIPNAYLGLDSLKQVFLNVIINAIQAMPEGGELSIATFHPQEKWIEIAISDTGCGIPQERLPHLFTPFFTTKGVGKGTGLGMYISHTIIRREGGDIKVESRKGVGTTVTIRLPALDKEPI